MNLLIRNANLNDLANIQQCAVAAYSLYIERIGKEPAPMIADFEAAISSHTLSVATLASQIAGFVVFYPREDHLHLENIAVDPRQQGQKIGYSLIKYVEDTAQKQRLRAV